MPLNTIAGGVVMISLMAGATKLMQLAHKPLDSALGMPLIQTEIERREEFFANKAPKWYYLNTGRMPPAKDQYLPGWADDRVKVDVLPYEKFKRLPNLFDFNQK